MRVVAVGLVVWLCLIYFVQVSSGDIYDDLQPLGPIGEPSSNKKIHDFLNNNQITPQLRLRIPKGLQSSLAAMLPQQNNKVPCNVTSGEEAKYSLDLELPRPDFFVIGLHNPAASEIITKICNVTFIIPIMRLTGSSIAPADRQNAFSGSWLF